MDRTEKALLYFDNKFNCAQAVLSSFANELGLDEEESLRVACAFGGGMGKQQFTCGAVTGATMALGLKFGKGFNDDEEKKQMTYEKTVRFFNEFIRLHGATSCRELLHNLDMNDDNDLNTINKQNLFHVNCRKYVADAVLLAEKLIENKF